ncbi:MAG: toxin HicA [Betaproteobacteria bacterium]|nr:toxin HicA [Betaproteobacteria bacterium]
MSGLEKILAKMSASPEGVRFSELQKVCVHFFGPARQRGTSHAIYQTPWPGDPRVNIQNDKGKAKVYQVKQVLEAVLKLKGPKHER